MTLEELLADWREKATDARRLGHEDQARAIEAVCDDVARVGEPLIRWLSEDKATLYTRRSTRWLRERFRGWERQGAARLVHGRRFYLQIVLPVPIDLEAEAADAERTAREDAAA
jgi:hypothetical protein